MVDPSATLVSMGCRLLLPKPCRLVRHSVPPASSAAVIVLFAEVSFHFAGVVLPYTKRNLIAVLLTGSNWLSLTTRCFGLFKGPSESKPSTRLALRRFADFIQRESDTCSATVLFVCLQE